MDFSKKLIEIRRKLNISQTKLAEMLNVDYSTVSRIERNIFKPSLQLIEKINILCLENDIETDFANPLLIKTKDNIDLFSQISEIIESSYKIANKTVNFLLIQRNFLIGKCINENIITNRKYDYGKNLIKNLSNYLTEKFGKGFDERSLYNYSDFANKFPDILNSLSTNSFLSWTHYRVLLQVSNTETRNWYVCEANSNVWSVRTLQRNISSQYYERIVSSNFKEEVKSEMIILNKENQLKNIDLIKDPLILEFLGLNEDNKFLESDLETAILNNLQKFLMELGKGYAFVARQQRIHTEKEDYYIDLVFYNYILKCFVLVDLKTSKISYQDVGQMDMYVKMYDELKKDVSDNPTLGIILTSDTDEDIARYSVLHGNEQLFASKYKLYLPTEYELKQEIERQKTFYLLKK